MSNAHRSLRGFTLIELLVVITIIGILAGLAFPALNGAMNAAKKAEAATMVNQLRTGLTSYQTEYGTWPASVTTEALMDADELYETLIGLDSPVGNNPRRIVFMEFNAKSLRAAAGDKSPPVDPSSATLFVDPWNNQYQMIIDVDYDNRITGLPAGATINAATAIWSTGKDTAKTSDDVVSWK
jgi:prepilin-type N-terminal cleavage/methylation domain-containing protein